jgi:orotate phosphoribosyltransferase
MITARELLKKAISKYSYRENLEQPFTLASGKQSPFYCDLKQTLFQPEYLKLAATLFWEKLTELQVNAVGGLTLGADPLVYSIALHAEHVGEKVFPVIVRKETKDHGSKKRFECLGSLKDKGDSLVLIDDVITTGGSTLKAYDALKDNFQIQHALCLVDREEGGHKAMADNGIKMHSIFKLVDFRKE